MQITKQTETATHFPLAGLIALALSGFLAIMTETLPAGLLPEIAAGLHITTGSAGQLVTLYAMGSILAAIPVIAATRSWTRKHLFLTAIGGFLVFNTLTAVAVNYWMALLARFAVGVAAGVVWGMLAGYARRMVSDDLAGRAMAIALVGTPIALSFGVPAGTWLGSQLGWRLVFGIMSIFAAVLLVFVMRALPDFPGTHGREAVSYRTVWQTPGVRPLLLVTLLWLGAHNSFYTYIAPFLQAKHMANVDVSLLVFGIAALMSIFLTGVLIDRHLRRLAIGSLVLFVISAVLLGLTSTPIVWIGLWGLSFGGAATLLQTALGQRVSDAALDIVMSLNATVWNVSIALAGALGGLLVQAGGAILLPWVTAVIAGVALLVVIRYLQA